LDLDAVTVNLSREPYKQDGAHLPGCEWEQNTDTVILYFQPPAGVSSRGISCKFTQTRFALGVTGITEVLHGAMPFEIDVDESTWEFVQGEAVVTLRKKLQRYWPSVVVKNEASTISTLPKSTDNGSKGKQSATSTPPRVENISGIHAIPTTSVVEPHKRWDQFDVNQALTDFEN